MNEKMQKLLEELNQLASKKAPKERTRQENILSRIRWWGYSLSVLLLMAAVAVGFGLPSSNMQRIAINVLGALAILLPTLVLIAEIIDGALLLIRFRSETFTALLKQTESDIACVAILSKYSQHELERAKRWIKNKIQKDSGRLSLFGTEKISLLAASGLLVSGWTVYEKTQVENALQVYQMGIFFVFAFIAGTILGSIFIKISHQRFKRMEMWLDLAMFEHELLEVQTKNGLPNIDPTVKTIRIAK